MKVRLTMDWLLHRKGDVITIDMQGGRRLISLGLAILHVEADEMLTREELVIAPKAIDKPPQDKMARPKVKKAVRKKRKKARRAVRRQPAREPVTQD